MNESIIYNTYNFEYDKINEYCESLENDNSKIDYYQWIRKEYRIAGSPLKEKKVSYRKNRHDLFEGYDGPEPSHIPHEYTIDPFLKKIDEEIKFLKDRKEREIESTNKYDRTSNNDAREQPNMDNEMNNNKLIFISHSSSDKIIVEEFVDKILQIGLGISANDIFCTSIQGMKIKTGDDFVKAIKDKLLKSKVVILLLSNNYKSSEICLNEMGAAWILGKVIYPLIIEPLEYDEVGFLNITKQIEKLTSSADLDNFKETIEQELGLESVKTSTWNQQKEKFLIAVNKLISNNEKTVKDKNDNNNHLSDASLTILKAINSSPTRTNIVLGIHLITNFDVSMIELHLEKLNNNDYLTKDGSYYSLTKKGKMELFGNSFHNGISNVYNGPTI